MKYLKFFLLAFLTFLLISNSVYSQPSKCKKKAMRQLRYKDDGAPKVGEVAPPIRLKSLDGKEKWDLAQFKGKKPVMIFFGSYT